MSISPINENKMLKDIESYIERIREILGKELLEVDAYSESVLELIRTTKKHSALMEKELRESTY